jgi:diaminobutyrate-2-oxoglutarate transaminase
VALIVDEIQSGFARTGKMFAFEHAGIVPDVVVLSKAIGGSLPLAVVVYRDWLDTWQPGAHAGTFRGNQMAMAAGSAVMRYLLEHKVCDTPPPWANAWANTCASCSATFRNWAIFAGVADARRRAG